MSQTLIANLDIEAKLAGLPLATALQRRLSALGTLLRVFARDDDDVLVLPTPLPHDRLPRLLDLPVPRLEIAGEQRGSAAWSAARSPKHRPRDLHAQALAKVAALRSSTFEVHPAPLPREAMLQLSPLSPLGTTTRATSAATLALHRSFGWALAQRIDAALPGAAMLATIAEVESWLCDLEARSGTSAWIGKHPLSAAGRQRIRGKGPLDEAQRAPLQRMLAAHEPLLFEPWHERIADVGCCGRVLDDGSVALLPAHRQLVASDGAFQGIVVERAALDELGGAEAHELSRVAAAVGGALAALGYRGPYGLDAWTYRCADGGRGFQALGELNARCTFGLVAHALAQRAFAADASATRCTLHFQPPSQNEAESDAPRVVYELLRPALPDNVGAWLTVEEGAPSLPHPSLP